jgi:hypothetical protein
VFPDITACRLRAISDSGGTMQDDGTTIFHTAYVEPQTIRDGAALAIWAVTMTMLVGAVMVAGVALTAVRLRITTRF